MKPKKSGFNSIDDYISTFPIEVQKRLEQLRVTIRSAVPKAEEAISYQMPAFKLDGDYFAHFAAWKKHIGIYPIPEGDAEFRKEIIPYMGAKSSLQFPYDKPLPVKLIRRLVKFRIVENLERASVRAKKKKS